VIELEFVLVVLAVMAMAFLSVVIRLAIERLREPRTIHLRRRHVLDRIGAGEPRLSPVSGPGNHNGGEHA
jgi:hypothetical protein